MDDSIEDINFRAQAKGRQMHDNWDAYMAGTLRELGKATGRERVYNRRADKYLKAHGYGKKR